MRTIHHSRVSFIGIAALLVTTLLVPMSVSAEDQVLALAPVAGPSWDVASGYHSVEESRIAIDEQNQSETVSAAAVGSWDAMSGYASVEASRLITARRALLSQELGSLQETALYALVTSGMAWDETSGYGSVEASRAAQ